MAYGCFSHMPLLSYCYYYRTGLIYILKLIPHRGRAPLSGELWRALSNREDGKLGMPDIFLWRGRIYLTRGDKKPGACKAPVWPWTELYQTPPPLRGGSPLWGGENSLSEREKDAGRDSARAGNLKNTRLRRVRTVLYLRVTSSLHIPAAVKLRRLLSSPWAERCSSRCAWFSLWRRFSPASVTLTSQKPKWSEATSGETVRPRRRLVASPGRRTWGHCCVPVLWWLDFYKVVTIILKLSRLTQDCLNRNMTWPTSVWAWMIS